MKKTILFIDNNFCLSLTQLKEVVSRRLEPDTPLYEELLVAYSDGVLEKWLSEGNTDEENLIKQQLNDLSGQNISDEIYLMNKLKEIIIGNNHNNVDVSSLLELESIKCWAKNEEIILTSYNSDEYNGEIDFGLLNINHDFFQRQVSFDITFKTKKKVNHTFEILLESDNGIVLFHDKMDISKSKGMTSVISIKNIEIGKQGLNCNLSIEGKIWKRVRISVNFSQYFVNGIIFDMVRVSGGTFMMGATEEQGSLAVINENPVHKVTLSDYWIGRTQVTQELWEVVMGNNPSKFRGNPKRPVEYVSWYDCQIFISKLNKMTGKKFRLPTEAEWEFAARGGMNSNRFVYSGSNSIDKVAWSIDNTEKVTQPVARLNPNELGLYDMSGNVFEWCQDWFGLYNEDDQVNPTGPSEGTTRVFRGGHQMSLPGHCRVSARFSYGSAYLSSHIGLRLAL